MAETTVTRNKWFLYKKWTLFLFTLLASIAILIVTITLNHNLPIHSRAWEDIIFNAGVGFGLLLIQALGFFGALKEKYTLVMSYSLSMAILAGILIGQWIFSPFWIDIIIVAMILVSIIASLLAKDFRDLSSAEYKPLLKYNFV